MEVITDPFPPIITFLSDYGLADDSVGICHGVIARICPSARVIDVTHGIPRQDVRAGAILFGEAAILRVGHAYEQATEWHRRRPALVAGAEAPDVTPPPILSGAAGQVDAATRDLCARAARRAGIHVARVATADNRSAALR